MDYSRIHEEAFSVEGVHFKKTKKRTNPKKADPFLILEGQRPLLVTAPHSVRYIRSKELCRSDIFTGALAYLLNNYTNCHALAVKKLYGGDPDYDIVCIFKDRLREFTDKRKINFLLDIQGAAGEEPFDVRIATPRSNAPPGQNNLSSIIARNLEKCGISKVTRNRAREEQPGSIIGFAAAELGIPALRVEISRRFRAPNGGGPEFDSLFAGLVDTLNEIEEFLP